MKKQIRIAVLTAVSIVLSIASLASDCNAAIGKGSVIVEVLYSGTNNFIDDAQVTVTPGYTTSTDEGIAFFSLYNTDIYNFRATKYEYTTDIENNVTVELGSSQIITLYLRIDSFYDPDHDQIPNSIDSDDDNDDILDDDDNCRTIFNPSQTDTDQDGSGDACDMYPDDYDNDGVSDNDDNCPDHCNKWQLDADEDGIGDPCDPDPHCGGCGEPLCGTGLCW